MNVRRSTSHATSPVGSVRNMPTIAMRVSRLARRVASRRPLHDCDVSTTTSGPGAPKNRLSALWELRAALRAGDVWLDHGRRYADPETYLIPRDRWPELRPEALRLTRSSYDAAKLGTPDVPVHGPRDGADLACVMSTNAQCYLASRSCVGASSDPIVGQFESADDSKLPARKNR